MFTSKIAILVRDDLAAWQKFNVTAFLASGIASAVPDCIGAPYRDGTGRAYTAMIGQPVLVFAAAAAELQRAHDRAREVGLTIAPYIEAMFATGHDAANRAAFAESDIRAPGWAGIALHGDRKAVDKAVKGLRLHP